MARVHQKNFCNICGNGSATKVCGECYTSGCSKCIKTEKEVGGRLVEVCDDCAKTS